MLIDARQHAGAELSADVAVVGGGPAGITLAGRLRGSGLTVLVLEAGGLHPTLRDQRAYAGDNVGHPYFRLDGCRYRLLGGSTNRWGGWCRPLEDLDFETRSYVADSGWPIDATDLRPYYDEAARLFELPSADFDLPSWASRLPTPFPLQDTDFENTVFQYSPETNFGQRHQLEASEDPDVTTVLHANVTDIRLDPGTERVASLVVQALGGASFTVRARAFVLAAGGLENPRLLLNATSDRPAGLGNQHDLVGRYFMEHLHVPAGHLVPADPAAISNAFYQKASYDGSKVRGVITPTVRAQHEHQLLGCSIGVEDDKYIYGTALVGHQPLVSTLPIRAQRPQHVGLRHRANRQVHDVLNDIYSKGRRWTTRHAAEQALARAGLQVPVPGPTQSLYFRTEQAPDRDSRVMLGETRDELGLRRITLDWRVTERDTTTIEQWLGLLAKALSGNGSGTVLPPVPGWEDKIIGGPHHMGTTRMAASAAKGVVDADCRVHGTANLYVAGSSVFPTGGYANPTFTIVTLALRLADRLRAELRPAAR
ncbi:MAG TPA: GMC family oxidoreductase [Actinomycetales bacterium]